jgi:serine protease SohB
MEQALNSQILTKKQWKKVAKQVKSKKKAEQREKPEKSRKRMYLLDFHGDIKATAVSSLREEITAVLTIVRPEDEVLVRLENSGGIVHEHGLAATQLRRLRDAEVKLTVAVDKVAASGGYMMACVANKIIAAPFAVVGSIGVLAQLPNFHNLLTRHGVEFEQQTAGQYKRTVTMFGKNTDQERQKLREQIEDMHELFKEFVARHRPQLDLKAVATGEYWYGMRAMELKLVDELMASDDYLLEASQEADIHQITFTSKKTVTERVLSSVSLTMDRLGLRGI